MRLLSLLILFLIGISLGWCAREIAQEKTIIQPEVALLYSIDTLSAVMTKQ